MSKTSDKFTDPGSERALLSAIVQNGKDMFIDASEYVGREDFTLPINKAIFQCLEEIYEDPTIESFDTEAIKLKAKNLGIESYLKGKVNEEYLDFLQDSFVDASNIKAYGYQIRKFSIIRNLRKNYKNAIDYIDNISGAEKLSEILQKAEEEVTDPEFDLDGSNKIETLSEGLDQYIDDILNKEIIDQIGIPTGYPLWDKAIGGGVRKSGVHMIAARPKTGKSFDALNKAVNISKIGIPVLYLDTELIKQFQQPRLLGIIGNIPIAYIETRKVQKFPELRERLLESKKIYDGLPLYYKNISGCDYGEVLSYIRRWIVKEVGFNEEGKANDCVIVYDYLKLVSGDKLAKHSPEYILIGLIMTELHNFAVKYGVPIISYVQVNRNGLDNDDTSIIAQSDRILWLCSSLSLLRNKDQSDIDMGSKFEFGNKKMSILDVRFGAGLSSEHDYINMHASLRPQVSEDEGTGLIKEGFLHSEVFSGYGNIPIEKKETSDHSHS